MTHYRHPFYLSVSIFVLSACAGVPVGPEAKGFAAALSTATAPIEAELAARTADEERAARAATIARGDEVYAPPIDCISAVALTPGTKLKDCALTPLNPAPEAPGSAKAMLAYIGTLRSYAAALDALATSNAPDRVGKAFGGLLTSFTGLVAVFPEFTETKTALTKVSPPLSSLAGKFAEGQRTRLIRKLVRDSSQGINEIIDRLIAYRDPDDGLTEAGTTLNAAYGRMEDARRSGNRAAFGLAVTEYEAANADLRARVSASDAGRLVLIREAQDALENRVEEPGDIESYVAFIETLKALSDALEQ